MSTSDAKALTEAAFAAWRRGEGDVFSLLADDVRWTITGSSAIAGTYTDRARFLAAAIAPISARLAEPIRPEVRSVVAEGDRVVVLWDGHAVAHDGGAYDNTYSWHLRFAGPTVVEVVAFFDAAPLDDLFARVAPTTG